MQRIDVDRLLAIAAEAFARHGFTGVGMREVSRECRVSLPTLYYYFGSKEKLFEEACRDRFQKALAQVRSGLDPDAAPEAQIQALGAGLFDLLTSDQTLFLLLRRDLIQGSLSQERFQSRSHYAGMIDIFGRLLSRRFDLERSARLAFIASGLIFGCCELAMFARGDEALLRHRRQDLLEALQRLLA